MDTIAQLADETAQALADAADLRALDAVRVSVLGKQGKLTTLLKELGRLSPDERRERGGALNALRDQLTAAIDARRDTLEEQALAARLASETVDVTLPPPAEPRGLVHPVSRTTEEIVAIFGAMGFTVAEGPDIETDWHNFGALNIPGHHPARADHDTFYLSPESHDEPPRVLRTHTSPVQIRTMLAAEPPLRIIVPGRVYRADHDATHAPMFHQVEGLVIDRGITMGHLKGCLIDFLRAFFALPQLPIRFRASYFPFTEPSMEVDIGWDRKSGQLGAGGDWLEILGSGMVHPKVLANCGLDPDEWQGFAFGMGIDRMAMLKNAIPDLRPMFDSDLRWLRHYGSSPNRPVNLHEGDR
jgi:phenylalanyl-tRNA synthetase alpha chain